MLPAGESIPMLYAHFTTTEGDFTIQLFEEQAPKTVANFTGLADGSKEWTDPRSGKKMKAPLYNGTIFHRVIDGFMIQGGGFTPEFRQKPTKAPIENEAGNGLKNTRYSVAMARTGDPHSATAQFFINVADNAFLDHKSRDAKGWGYCVFGRVVAGTEIVDRIKGVATGDRGMHQNVPKDDVLIERVEVTA